MAYGLVAVFALILLKEAGVPVPVPSDVLMLGAAARAATGQWSLPAVILTVELAMILGGSAQYALVRGPGRRFVYRVGRYVGLTPERLERAAAALQRGGTAAVALGLATPGVRAATIAAAGIADLPFRVFFPALLAGDSVFFLLHVAIGYAGGRGLGALASVWHTGSGPILLGVLVAIALVGLVLWFVVRRRRAARTGQGDAAAIEAWTEGACPVCLALAVLEEHRAAQEPAPVAPA